MSSDDDGAITNGELFRAVGLIRGDISGLRTELASRPSTADVERIERGLLDRITAAAASQAMKDTQSAAAQLIKDTAQDKAIAGLESWNTWALRLGGPAVAAALVGVVLNASRIA